MPENMTTEEFGRLAKPVRLENKKALFVFSNFKSRKVLSVTAV